ncbi:MAG: type II toxin-antitoxin system RelE/ParE family toxin [Rhodospirillaceae bacterium]|nr:type II toxin-antitoxin system RelE/ParE family toxin [Rhodospirillaceae bacterium]
MKKPFELSKSRAAKPVTFVGSSLDDLRDLPKGVKRQVGFQLDKVQYGEAPDDMKPMPAIGNGAAEIRIRDEAGAFRAVYVAKFEDAVYVLHVFQKKTQKTAQKDLDLATARYKEMALMRRRI